MGKKSFFILLVMAMMVLSVSCGSRSSGRSESIDGTYVYQDGISRSVVTISGESWIMKTQFGAPGYYGSDAKYDSGKVKGNTLYHSGVFEYGKDSGRTLRLAERSYHKQ
jgi:hypothetical protein